MCRRTFTALCCLLILVWSSIIFAAAIAPPSVEDIQFTQETLPNGLRVIYAPLHQAKVVQVRMLYHVGSRDERPDRQGFAHMFEHMMFRGSRHVPPQEHMRLVDQVGGICNAFTSFDETVYHDTIPSEDLELALYLEADRMSSFKVTDQIYQIERKVVAQEWMLRQNQPYGTLMEDLVKTAFTTSNYQWTPIGNMQQLLAAPAAELQEFFNTYYVPNNAVLVIAGDVDVAAAKAMVQKYYAWIPAGASVPRRSPVEPPQTQMRASTTSDRLARLKAVVLGYHIPEYKSDEHYAFSVLSAILGEGSSSRLEKKLVNNDAPLCQTTSTLYEALENGGIFGVVGEVKPGKDAQKVKEILLGSIGELIEKGVTPEELASAKTQRLVEMITGRETAEGIATQVGNDALWASDPNRANHDLEKLQAVNAADIQAIARKYLQENQVTELIVEPDPTGVKSRKNARAQAAQSLFSGAPVAPSTQPIVDRQVVFPADYPQHPPLPAASSSAVFAKGIESTVNGIRVIVISDHRLPMVHWTMALNHGSHSNPADKAGLASLTNQMLSRGTEKFSFQQLSDDLHAHGIELGVSDLADNTRLFGSSTSDEAERGFARSRDILLTPTFPAEEFAKLKDQAFAELVKSLAVPSTVADREIQGKLFAGSPLSHPLTPSSLASITLADVKKFYADFFHPNGAVLVISGDITPQRGEQLARQLTDGWQPKEMPAVEYNFEPPLDKRTVTLVDTADSATGAGAIVKMGIRAYDIRNEDKYVGALVNTLLSAGIESRLAEYVRAQKGFVYGISGVFQPGRHVGSFLVTAPTRPQVVGECIEAIYKVLDDLKQPAGDNPLADRELAGAKRRIGGSLVMGTQTIAEQASQRLEGILNGYPADYYDNYPKHLQQVTPDQVRQVVAKYVKDKALNIVVVAPATVVKSQLIALGQVDEVPMPMMREKGPATQPTNILQPGKNP